MSYGRLLVGTAAALLPAATPLAAPAQSAPQIVGAVVLNYMPGGSINTSQFGTTQVGASYGAASLSIHGTPSPTVTANADAGSPVLANVFARGVGSLYYDVRIVGPAGPVPVLIDVAGAANGIATSGATFAVESRWSLSDYGYQLAGDRVRSGQIGGSFAQSFDRTVSLALQANRTYTIFLQADASAGAAAISGHAYASAYVDPVFSFGPNVDQTRYAFAFSAGIGNTAGGGFAAASLAAGPDVVPEPATLALVGTGLLVLGWRGAGRARRAVIAAA